MKTKEEIFEEKFDELTTNEQVELYNMYAEKNHHSPILPWDEYTVNEYFQGVSPFDVIYKLRNCNLSDADYFVEDVYFETFSESEIYDEIIKYEIDDIYENVSWEDIIDEDDIKDEIITERSEILGETYLVDDDYVDEFLQEEYDAVAGMYDEQELIEEFTDWMSVEYPDVQIVKQNNYGKE